MTYRHQTTMLLEAAGELSRGDRIGLSRARLAFQSLAEADDERDLTDVIRLILLGANTDQDQKTHSKRRAIHERANTGS